MLISKKRGDGYFLGYDQALILTANRRLAKPLKVQTFRFNRSRVIGIRFEILSQFFLYLIKKKLSSIFLES